MNMVWNDGAVKIDNGWYKDINGDVVEIVPKKVDCKVGDEVVSFEENSQYENSYGLCLIRLIRDDGTMDVSYIRADNSSVSVGDWKNYPVKAQAETILNERRRQAAKLALKGIKAPAERMAEIRSRTIYGSEMFTMGFLAANSSIIVHTKEEGMDAFREDYKAITGVDAVEPGKPGSTWYVHPSYWGAMGVTLPKTSDKVLDQLRLENVCESKSSAWKTQFVWGLFQSGLHMGRNSHRLEEIASNLSGSDLENFWAGVNADRDMAIAA